LQNKNKAKPNTAKIQNKNKIKTNIAIVQKQNKSPYKEYLGNTYPRQNLFAIFFVLWTMPINPDVDVVWLLVFCSAHLVKPHFRICL
jgi:hypothetical protein